MRVGHPESRAGLATVQGWNGGREADLLYPTPPHNLGMPTGPETGKAHTHNDEYLYFKLRTNYNSLRKMDVTIGTTMKLD